MNRMLRAALAALAIATTACGGGGVTELDQAAKPGGGTNCRKGTVLCSGVCVKLETSPTNCGACGNVCATGATCSAGVCTCPSGQLACNGACIDVQSDPYNCGACGNACAAGDACTAGVCVPACGGGLTSCGAACVDLQTDRYNCGACGNACRIDQACTAGACVTNCGTGLTNCSDVCVDLQSDEANCGACGVACATGATCTAGACACPAGHLVCNGACLDVRSDPNNCGACGNVCTAQQYCDAGACRAIAVSGCTGCHAAAMDDPASAGSARRPVVGDFALNSHHVYSAGTTGTYRLTDHDCAVCHAEALVAVQGGTVTSSALHKNGLVELRDADDAAAYYQYDKRQICIASGGTAAQCDTASTATTPVPWGQTNAAKWGSGLPPWRSEMSGRADDLVGAPTVACNPVGTGCKKGLDRFCISCHDADGASAAFQVGEIGATALNPFFDQLISNAYDLQNRGGVVDVASRVHVAARTAAGGTTSTLDRDLGGPGQRGLDGRADPIEGVFARHAIRGLSLSTYGGTTASLDTSTYFALRAGDTTRWASSSVMGCADCHATDGANGVRGNAHGSGGEYLLKDGQGGATEPAPLATAAYVCARCHAAAAYSPAHTANTSDWQDYAASVGAARVPAGSSGGNVFGIACFNCHGGVPDSKAGALLPTGSTGEGGWGTIHGTSQVLGVGQNGSAGFRSAYRFMNGNSMRFYDPAGWTTSAQRTCYTLSTADAWGGCTKHGSGAGMVPKPAAVRPLGY